MAWPIILKTAVNQKRLEPSRHHRFTAIWYNWALDWARNEWESQGPYLGALKAPISVFPIEKSRFTLLDWRGASFKKFDVISSVSHLITTPSIHTCWNARKVSMKSDHIRPKHRPNQRGTIINVLAQVQESGLARKPTCKSDQSDFQHLHRW